MGLCSSLRNKTKCWEEGDDLPVRSTILVEHTSTTLLLHAASMRETYDLGDPDTDMSTYFLPKDNDETSEGSEQRRRRVDAMVADMLRRVSKRFPGPPGPPKEMTVLLTGDTMLLSWMDCVKSSKKLSDMKSSKLRCSLQTPSSLLLEGPLNSRGERYS
jgi:hypothetical protein